MDKDNKQNPLVTIIIITYNSMDYVIQTLESAKRQTYTNIELIISDDASKDNTVKVCRDWLENNKNSFKNVQLITTNNNSGIPGNCNRGVKKSNGEWIKLIAGDDILVGDCLELFMDAIAKDKSIEFLAGRFQTFTSKNGVLDIKEKKHPKEEKLSFFDLTPPKQLKMLLTGCDFGFAPATFIKKDLFIKFGFFNEEFRFMEDLPYWIKLAENGVKFHLMNNTVTYYRKGHGSVLESNTHYFNVNYMCTLFNFKRKIVYKKVPKTNFLFYQAELVDYFHYHFIRIFFRNRKTKLSFIVGKLILLFSIKLVLSKITEFKFNKLASN